MTQVVDLETFITAANSDPDPNFPPESTSIPIHDYLDLSAAVYDRDDSTKESTNPKSQSHQNPTQSRSNSQRLSSSQSSSTGTNLKANGPILGLPNKIKHVTCHVTRRNVKPNAPIFPKNKRKQPPAAAVEFEPSSPKVSCIGKVLSDRERRENCRRACRRRSGGSGCWARISKLLFSCGSGKSLEVQKGEDIFTADVEKEKEKSSRQMNIPLVGGGDDVATEENIPGLGGMKRFSSGRRGESWGNDVEFKGHVAVVDLSRQSSVNEKSGSGVHVI